MILSSVRRAPISLPPGMVQKSTVVVFLLSGLISSSHQFTWGYQWSSRDKPRKQPVRYWTCRHTNDHRSLQDSGAIDVTLEGGEDDEVGSTNSNTDGRSNEQLLQSGEKERPVNVAVIGNEKLGTILGKEPNGQDDETTKAQAGNRMEAVNPTTKDGGMNICDAIELSGDNRAIKKSKRKKTLSKEAIKQEKREFYITTKEIDQRRVYQPKPRHKLHGTVRTNRVADDFLPH